MDKLKSENNVHHLLSGSESDSDMDRLALGRRIREAREALGVSRNEAAAQVKVSLSTFQAWEAGEREPDATKIAIYAQLHDLSVDWLLFGAGAMKKKHVQENGQANKSGVAGEPVAVLDTLGNRVDVDDFVFVPRYDINAAAGHGQWPEHESPRFSMAFRRFWIENYLHADPTTLSVIAVKGDSMEGVLNDRDVILINHSDNRVTNGIYVLRIEGDLVVKRVQCLPGGLLEVKSANDAYTPFTIDPANHKGDFAVIGRVVWFGRQIA